MDKSDPVKRVVGLRYLPEQGAPRVVLKGAGVTADAVLEEAARPALAVPVVEDGKLLDRLYRLPLDAAIDPDLFELVAVLLVHVYAVDENLQRQRGLGGDDAGLTTN